MIYVTVVTAFLLLNSLLQVHDRSMTSAFGKQESQKLHKADPIYRSSVHDMSVATCDVTNVYIVSAYFMLNFLFVINSFFLYRTCQALPLLNFRICTAWCRLSPRAVGTRSSSVVTYRHTDRSATYDFLLVIHSNHGPISYGVLDTRRFRSQIFL